MMSGNDILFTTIHVITDWPISDHMNWDLTQRSCTAIWAPIVVLRERPLASLCALPGSAQHCDPVPAVSSGLSETPIVGRDLCMR
ncbi:unnamed protein product, partial [Staurois parvus]